MSENITATTVSEYVAAKPVTVDVVKFHGTRTERVAITGAGHDWEYNAYRLRINVDGRSIETPWKQGLGVTTSPDDEPADVFASLVSDARDHVNALGFEDWASCFGYDPDSRRAYKTWQACGEVADDLRTLLGDDFDTVMSLENDV